MSGTNPRRPPQFCPGLAAFTDAIEALPQETIRHFTLLREVDAKASGPEDLLRSFIKHALSPPPLSSKAQPQTDLNADPVGLLDDGNRGLHSEALPHPDELPSNLLDDNLSDEHTKRSRLHQVRVLISDLLLTLDEKIHVISTASEALAKHQVRIDDAYDATTLEIEPILRDGNPAHWAYGNSILEGSFNQRPGVNEIISTTVYPVEPDPTVGPSRTEGRREGASRRYAHAPDPPDPKAPSHAESTALPYENSPSIPAAKRRKGTSHGAQLNKTLAPERNAAQSRSGVYSNSHVAQTAKAQPVARVHGPQTSVTNTKPSNSRKRAPGQPAINALSPTKHNFMDPRAAAGQLQPSETPVATGPIGGRKDAAHKNPRSKPHSAKPELPRAAPKIDNSVKQEDKMLPFESKSAPTPKVPQDKLPHPGSEGIIDSGKEAAGRQDEPMASQEIPMNVAKDTAQDDRSLALDDLPPNAARGSSIAAEAPDKINSRGVSSSSGKSAPKPSLVSDTLKNSQMTLPKAIPTTKPSKLSNDPPLPSDDKSAVHNPRDDYDDDDDEGDVDADEMRYCYCNQVSYGKMVACDGPGCQREWFHLPCVGLSHMPSSKDKWYCRECRTGLQNPSKSSKAGQHRV
ncbi:hypothetical protein TWF281_007373 [Arthrobotrys megalospora]